MKHLSLYLLSDILANFAIEQSIWRSHRECEIMAAIDHLYSNVENVLV